MFTEKEILVHRNLFEALSGGDVKCLQGLRARNTVGFQTFVDLGIFDENGLYVAYHGPYRPLGKDYLYATT